MLMPIPEALILDFERIFATGVTHTGTVIELMQLRGWTQDQILPIIYQLLLRGRLDPNGIKIPFREN